MKPYVRYIIAASAVTACLFLWLVGDRIGAENSREVTCNSVDAIIADSLAFISPDDIKDWMADYGTYLGLRLDSVDLKKVEAVPSRRGLTLLFELCSETAIRVRSGPGEVRRGNMSFLPPLEMCNAGDPGLIPGWGRSAGEGIDYPLQYCWASLVAQLAKNPPAMREIWVRYLGWEDPLEKGKATHSSILAWRIPCTIQSIGLQRVGHD